MRKITATVLLLFTTLTLHARKFEVPADYSFRGNYEAYQKDIVRAIDWLARTAPDRDVEKRRAAKTFVSKWIMGAPHVTVALNSETLALRKISGDLYSAYVGGSIKHSIKTGNSDLPGSTYEGMKAAVKYYRKHKKKLGGNETFDKYVKLQKQGKLREYLEKSE